MQLRKSGPPMTFLMALLYPAADPNNEREKELPTWEAPSLIEWCID